MSLSAGVGEVCEGVYMCVGVCVCACIGVGVMRDECRYRCLCVGIGVRMSVGS